MQIGGLGSSHSAGDHHVTNCIHDHHEEQNKAGGIKIQTSASVEAPAVKADAQPEGQLSLAAWLKNALGSGRGFLLNFWNDGQAAVSAEGRQTDMARAEGRQAAASRTVAQAENPDAVTAAAAALHPVMNTADYNSAAENAESSKHILRRKMKSRLYNVFKGLSRRQPAKSSGNQAAGSFHAGQQKAGEDLRRPDRHRRDTVEIDCVRAEESYLLDSYDRKGEYSRLTVKK